MKRLHDDKVLKLVSTRSSWRIPAQHGTELDKSKRMKEVRKIILERDNYTCYYCGFRSERHQEIHHLDHNHDNYDHSNLTTVCPLCHQASHLSTVGDTGGGSIIWLPEISQVDLNRLCIAIFIALKSGQDEWVNSAKSLYVSLDSRKHLVTSALGNEASDPMTLAQSLLKMPQDELNKRSDEFLAPLRLLPLVTRFDIPVDYWISKQYKDLPVGDAWKAVIPESMDVFEMKNKSSMR